MNLKLLRTLVLSTALLLPVGPAVGAPLDNKFTYQARLTQGGEPVTTMVNLAFTLWRDSVSVMPADQIGGAQTIALTPDANGLFTVELNDAGQFGANPFNGEKRWLEITVDANTLAPRQELSGTPYALQTRGLFFDETSGNVGIGPFVPQAKLHVTHTDIGNVAGLLDPNEDDIIVEGDLPWIALVGDDVGGVAAGISFTEFGGANDKWAIYRRTSGNVGDLNITYGSDVNPTANQQMLQVLTDGTTKVQVLDVTNTDIGDVSGNLASFENDIVLEDELPWIAMVADDVGNTGAGISFGEFGGANDKWAIYRQTSGNVGSLKITYGTNVNATMNDLKFQILPDGTTKVQVLEITGADVAERFAVSEPVEPGMVVEIDPKNVGQLRPARGAYNRRVAGVVSGAGDLPVGAVLGNLPGVEKAPAVALTGRVYCRCDASSGPIEPGDLLTTSDTPGHAMKVTDHPRAQGAILGKAMGSLESGKGLVLVLVSLQ